MEKALPRQLYIFPATKRHKVPGNKRPYETA